METFIKRYITERTNKAESRLEEQGENKELFGELMEPKTDDWAKTEIDVRKE